MKTASVALTAHLNQAQTTLAYLWKLVRTDGTTYGFTTHDQDIKFDDGSGCGSLTYLAMTGFTNAAQASKSDLSVDNSEFTGFLESESLLDADIRAGLFDDAVICVFVVNWQDLTMGSVLLRTGTLGNIKMKNGMFTAEIRGLTHRLNTSIGSLYGPVCRAIFGSGLNGIDMDSQWKCMKDVTAYRQTGSVASSSDGVHITPSSGLLMVGSPTPTSPAGAGWFDDGLITFTSGPLNGKSFEIKSWDGTVLILYLPMPAQPAASNTFNIEPGCNHTIFDCLNKYQNQVNFRGENSIPGEDDILNYPGAGGTIT